MKHGKHKNIPIFVVHMGCPNQCVFCDQHLISGTSFVSAEMARAQIEAALLHIPRGAVETEIAFFGGSFTGIDRAQMLSLLNLAEEYVARGDVSGIRLSTRPDYISEEIAQILSQYTVRAVELGVQSMSDAVLARARRGHTAADTARAVDILRQYRLPFIGQMMVGLPAATAADEVYTAQWIAAQGAVGFRLYPTLVFAGTELAAMTVRKEYTPLTVPEAVFRMREVLSVFDRADIPCLRAGLCESENLRDGVSVIAGPNHPAIGELARSAVFLARFEETLLPFAASLTGATLTIEVARGAASAAAGQHKCNTRALIEKYGIKNIKILEKEEIFGYNNTIGICCENGDLHTENRI